MPHAVAEKPNVRIGTVFPPREFFFSEVSEHIGTAQFDQGPYDTAVVGGHGRKTRRSRPPEDPHQRCFQRVIRSVGDKNANLRFFGHGSKAFCLTEPRPVAEQTRRGLYANTVLFGGRGYSSRFDRNNLALYVKFFTEALDEFGVAAAFSLRSDPVLNMDTAEIKNSVFIPDSGKRNKHGNGIRAA